MKVLVISDASDTSKLSTTMLSTQRQEKNPPLSGL
jgi:hypothetical protein